MTRELRFDPVQLSRRAEEMSRSMPVALFPELMDRLASEDGLVVWSIAGERTLDGIPRLRLQIEAKVQLTCQRCLNPIPWTVSDSRILMIYPDEDHLPDLDDEPDDVESMVAAGDLDALALVTEELLLALPMMPLHETEACHMSVQEDATGRDASPFALLKQLKKGSE